ncbi:hypothetical protein FEM48_Zijuj10G0144600 [Ziziphus jujuba var. spinosa]|uniref:Uncharacterized protein n=1 Tax=Ziziphus jujuba var. spinosa TaxID=714518 RepID=A0A978UNX6_ZIZJJ|nr:hypothetical protein FEM48_Zijuj10G0144600 [Ziziphus jujuba var. spinosa]
MNQCGIQQNVFSVCEEMRSSSMDRRDPVVCPKPRRLGLLNSVVHDHPIRSFRWHISHQAEPCDSRARSELLDIILTKGGYGVEVEQSSCTTQIASSPPFFCGSPPSRVANPLIQDARFGDEKAAPFSPLSPIPPPNGISSASPSAAAASSARKGGCVRANFGNKPAVRIEGFDCLDRDRRNCSIPALA